MSDCPDCGTALRESDLESSKIEFVCVECAPEFVKWCAFDDYDGPYSRYK
jgi:hypothetical protein